MNIINDFYQIDDTENKFQEIFNNENEEYILQGGFLD